MKTILIVCLSILFLPLTLAAETGFTVSGGTEDTDYSHTNNVYTVLTGTPLTFLGSTTTDRIVIAEGVTADITLNDVSIDVSGIDNAGAIRLEKKAKLTLHLAGTESTLKSGNNAAGIGLSVGSDLHITAESTSSKLSVVGGNNSNAWGSAGAGIGGNLSEEGKAAIRISNGNISTKGGTNSASFGNSGDGIGQSGDRQLKLVIVFDGGEITAKGGNESNHNSAGYDIYGDVTINNGTITDSSISGTKVIINKGTINNNTDINNISGDYIIINGGTINISCKNKPCIDVSNSKCLEINGGNINVNTLITYGYNPAGEAAAIGPSQGSPCGIITINGGLITAKLTGGGDGGGTAIGGAGKNWVGSYNEDGGKITINGGTITAVGASSGNDIGGGWENAKGVVKIFGGSVNAKRIKTLENNVYLGITPDIANATDVSVDGVPYYISGNHPQEEGKTADNKLYLYMTGAEHTITVRKNDNSVTTYTATYVSGGVDSNGNNKGYFSFDTGSTTTPTKNSAIAFETSDITTTYNTESNQLTVKLTVTEPEVTTRSAAMNSMQLILKDETNTYTYYSDRQTVTSSGDYEFTFDTKGLNAGNYTLIANYGGLATSLAADQQTKTLKIEKATPSYTAPTNLTATYGQTLANVALSGSWAWNDAMTTPVGNAGTSSFTATFTPDDVINYKTVEESLSIAVNKATPTASNFTFTAPTDLVYNGSKKEANVQLKSGLTGAGTINLKYYKKGESEVTDPINAGEYTVKIDVAGGNNFNAANDLIDTEWTFTILSSYAITIASPLENGTVTADKTRAPEGETVTLTITPATGYEPDALSYTTTSGTVTITGTTFVMPAADVTVTATFKASVPPVKPPVDPDVPDTPTARHTVTLPVVEGATIDPAAGSYEVDRWSNFSFLLTLDEGYRKDSHPVVTARGETIHPEASTGKYIIRNVRSDLAVEITGIVKDIATGNESLSAGFRITASDGLLLITAPRAARLYLTDASGRLINTRRLSTGTNRIEGLAAGIYFVAIEGEEVQKISVK